MTPEISDNPSSTPNPDWSPVPETPPEQGQFPPATTPDDDAVDEEVYDSRFDALDQKLSQSIDQPAPDPVLSSQGGEALASNPSVDDPIRKLMASHTKSPRTSEVFKAVVGLRAEVAGTGPAQTMADVPPGFFPEGDSPDPEKPSAVEPGSPQFPAFFVEQQPTGALEPTSDDGSLDEHGFPWSQVLILSYASAVTLALIWLVWTGRAVRTFDTSPNTNRPAAASEPASPSKDVADPRDDEEAQPLPAGNVTTLRVPLSLGELRVEPLSISLAQVELIDTVEPSNYRVENDESLVLRMRFTNLSKEPLSPLELAYVREQPSRLDRCFITTSHNKRIGVYPLAAGSQWSIVGQESPVLKPGESVETLVASKPGAAEQMGPEMVWRFRVRIGATRTDVVGVSFRQSEVTRDP
jgi:hypothetical protein